VGGRGFSGIWGLKFCFDIVLIIIVIPILEYGIWVGGGYWDKQGDSGITLSSSYLAFLVL